MLAVTLYNCWFLTGNKPVMAVACQNSLSRPQLGYIIAYLT